jgi:protein-S-isoprenylcysteine O-methyltransferase Ste14/ferredoxin
LPIDPDFQKKRKKVGKEDGVAVWGPVDPPEKLGIRGTNVAVDWDICKGCGVCLDVCPMHVYGWKGTSGHPTSDRKPSPTGESECACCYECEAQCPVQAIRVVFGPPKSFIVAVPLMFAQIIVSVIYGIVFGPYLGLSIPFYVGWMILVVGLPFFFSPSMYFPKAQEGKSVMDTRVIVDSGTYGIVRHPQVLGCILLMCGSIFISQHWLSAIVAVPIFALFYRYVLKEEKTLIVKFGNDYKCYMQRVPSMNFIVGIIRLLKFRKHE